MAYQKVPTDIYGDINGTKTACVSLLDENYNLSYKPLLIDV